MNAQTQFTPGPWVAIDIVVHAARTLIVGTRNPVEANALGPMICDLAATPDTGGYCTSYDEAVATARLIAAAPRMYARIAQLAADGDVEAQSILENVNGRS